MSAITLPCWLALGFPLPTAVAADKTAATLWTAVASRNYLAGRTFDWSFIVGLAVLGVFGSIAGAHVTMAAKPALMKPIIGGIILLLVAACWIRKDFGVEIGQPRLGKLGCSVLAVPLGFYEGCVGSGNSIISALTFCRTRGFDLITSLGHYYVLAFVWCGAAALAYFGSGYLNWSLTLPAVLGSVAGAQIGSKVASRVGPRPVKILFSIAGIIFGARLIF